MASSQNPLTHTGVAASQRTGVHGPPSRTSSSSATPRATCTSGRRSAATPASAGRHPCPAPTGGRRWPWGWRRGVRWPRAGPSRSDRPPDAGRSATSRPPTSPNRVGAERHLHRAAPRRPRAQIEPAVVLGALDAAVDQQPAGEVRLAVRAHAVEEHVAVVRPAQHERRRADVDPGSSPGASRSAGPRSVMPAGPWSATCPVAGSTKCSPPGRRGSGGRGSATPGRGAGGAGRRRSRGRHRARTCWGAAGVRRPPGAAQGGRGTARSGTGGARGGSSCSGTGSGAPGSCTPCACSAGGRGRPRAARRAGSWRRTRAAMPRRTTATPRTATGRWSRWRPTTR